jgi:DNA-binding NtrC family response regulator
MPETLRVLLIDDEKIFVESLIRVLKRRGITVQSAHDGPTGVELFAPGEYDVVVLDMRMPGMDGLATFKAIRDQDPTTPVIFLSGHMDINQVSQALKDGCAEILLKPCPVDQLVSCIEDAAERKHCFIDVAGKSLRRP